jgi:hypothetical protein
MLRVFLFNLICAYAKKKVIFQSMFGANGPEDSNPEQLDG